MITHQRLLELIAYDPETGSFTHRQQRRGVRKGSRAGSRMPIGYWNVRVDGEQFYLHRLAWFYVHGTWPDSEVDHINRDKGDNRIANLRLASHHENTLNRPVYANNTSGSTGVTFDKARGKWKACIFGDKYIGRFATKEEAVAARDAAAKREYGAFFPE